MEKEALKPEFWSWAAGWRVGLSVVTWWEEMFFFDEKQTVSNKKSHYLSLSLLQSNDVQLGFGRGVS